jgi:hypothetical protein
MKDENHVVARRALFPTTLAPYASAVSNLLVFWGIALPKSTVRDDTRSYINSAIFLRDEV